MLKKAYVGLAQALPAFPPMRNLYRQSSDCRDATGWSHWFASLGAVYHVERMVALDIPWWNVAATSAVNDFLRQRPGAKVFEYGSGASSVWLAKRVQAITTVEHDVSWASQMRNFLVQHDNAKLILADCDIKASEAHQIYVRTIDAHDDFDLIVVDGRLRSACLEASIPHLKPDGLILFDDSGRRRYRKAIEDSGLVEELFFGRSYCVPYPDHTSLLSRPRP